MAVIDFYDRGWGINPSGIARLAYSGIRLNSIRNTTCTGPPWVETNSISRSIFSSISSEAASANTPIIGISTSRNT